MQDRFATWGETNKSESLLLAILFDEKELNAKLYIYPKKTLPKESEKLILDAWNSGEDVELPEPKEIVDVSLSEDSLLPENIRIQETGKLRRLQNEWAYHILSNKLWESFLDEMNSLKLKVDQLEEYDAELFEQSKSLWERLLSQKRDKNISQEKLDSIKEELNGIFEKLKELRKEHVRELDQKSIEIKERYDVRIEEIKTALSAGNANYKELFENLKQVQTEIRGHRIRKTHKSALLSEISNLFQELNKRRRTYGEEKLQKRLEGLQKVIFKMENSINKDKKELDFQHKRSDHPGTSQLEAQLRQAKIAMIEDTIRSKEEKLSDIIKTFENLKKKTKD